jgi:hypothetical protein
MVHLEKIFQNWLFLKLKNEFSLLAMALFEYKSIILKPELL